MVYLICRSDVCNILFRINKAQLLQIATEWTLRGLQRLVNKEEIQIFLWGFVLCCIKKPKTLQQAFQQKEERKPWSNISEPSRVKALRDFTEGQLDFDVINTMYFTYTCMFRNPFKIFKL